LNGAGGGAALACAQPTLREWILATPSSSCPVRRSATGASRWMLRMESHEVTMETDSTSRLRSREVRSACAAAHTTRSGPSRLTIWWA
jgi:hypothetical protein